jgi:hypothetical protein
MYGKKHSPETIEKIKKTWERKRQEKSLGLWYNIKNENYNV